MNISAILKERRVALKITQQELSEISGVSIATIKDIERGKGNPSLKTLEQIGIVLGLEICMKIKETF